MKWYPSAVPGSLDCFDWPVFITTLVEGCNARMPRELIFMCDGNEHRTFLTQLLPSTVFSLSYFLNRYHSRLFRCEGFSRNSELSSTLKPAVVPTRSPSLQTKKFVFFFTYDL